MSVKPWIGFEIAKIDSIKDTYNLLDFQQYSVYRALNTKNFFFKTD